MKIKHKKLTDNEIKKVCKNCIHFTTCIFCNGGGGCTAKDCDDYIEADLINRLQAENERLKESNRLLINNPILDWQDDWENEIKAEAYKHCIEKIKVELKDINKIQCQDDDYYVLHSTFFDNLLKKIGR